MQMITAATLLSLLFLCSGADAAPIKGSIVVSDKKLTAQEKREQEAGLIGVKTDWDRTVVKVHHASPAEASGVRVGDKVFDVNFQGAKAPLRGSVGTQVLLTVTRNRLPVCFLITRCSVKQIKDLEHQYYCGDLSP